ncbi:hypothetical protein BJX96DRAFT_181507 [Aspergillus floccosus]
MLVSGVIFPIVASLAREVSGVGVDPVDNFCTRRNHQSVVKDGRLYIDGGLETFAQRTNDGEIEDNRILGYNTELIEVDLRSPWDAEHNISITTVPITANPHADTDPPLVVRGAMYSGLPTDSKIYLYGGRTSYANTSFPGFQEPPSSQYPLWSYDTAADIWSQYDVTADAPYRPAGGSYADAPDLGLAFYLNGFIDNGTSDDLEYMSNFRRYLDGLIVINMDSLVVTNVSTIWLRRAPRAKGGMVYVPGIGPQGMLVDIGGVTKPTTDSSASNDGTYVTFDKVDFLDVSSIADDSRNATWFVQRAAGEVPPPRTDFCLVTASAKDNSSHNIYLYGGKGTHEAYDDVYVLSIPSFTWKRVYRGESPRYGHTCHLVGNRQMLAVGGVASDGPMSRCDGEQTGVAVFDLTDLEWRSVYSPSAPAYQVPGPILRTIGGHPDGNASMKAPPHGFSTRQIAHFFHEPPGDDVDDDILEDGDLEPRDISGIVIGSVGAVGLILGSVYFWLRHKKRRESDDADAESAPWTEEKEIACVESKDFACVGSKDFAYVGAVSRKEDEPQRNHLHATAALQEIDANHVRAPTDK